MTGNEPIYPFQITDDRVKNQQYSGLTIKEHMVIEFTKAIIAGINSNNQMHKAHAKLAKTEGMKIDDLIVQMAIEYANTTIKQLNEEK